MVSLVKRVPYPPLDVAALWGLMIGSRVLLAATTTQNFVRITRRATDLIPSFRTADPALLERVKSATYLASKLTPGSHCLHRAASAKCYLAFRGIGSQIVVGFRKRQTIDGHAWLEVDVDDGVAVLFASDDDGFKATWTPS